MKDAGVYLLHVGEEMEGRGVGSRRVWKMQSGHRCGGADSVFISLCRVEYKKLASMILPASGSWHPLWLSRSLSAHTPWPQIPWRGRNQWYFSNDFLHPKPLFPIHSPTACGWLACALDMTLQLLFWCFLKIYLENNILPTTYSISCTERLQLLGYTDVKPYNLFIIGMNLIGGGSVQSTKVRQAGIP